MKIKKKSLALIWFFSFSLLFGCTNSNYLLGIYKPKITQGNIIDEKNLKVVKQGMTKEQVAYVLGQPILDNIFNQDNWDYVYTVKISGKKSIQKTLSLVFKENKLISITKQSDNE